MVAIVVSPPAFLPANFSHKGHVSMEGGCHCPGGDVERYESMRLMGALRSVLNALEAIACDGDMTITIRTEKSTGPTTPPRVQIPGQINLWQYELRIVAEAAVAEINAICFDIARRLPKATVSIAFHLKRELSKDAA